jgi:hypothetical protein
MKSVYVTRVLAIIAAIAMVSMLVGCEGIFGGDEDEEKDGGLTVRIETTQASPCGGTDEPMFFAFVYPAGSTDDEGWVAVGANWFTDQNGVNVSEVVIHENSPNENPNDNAVWTGDAGMAYDVYPVIYCAPGGDPSQIDLSQMEKIHKGPGDLGWGVPLTYTQDGDQTFTTAGSDYVDP